MGILLIGIILIGIGIGIIIKSNDPSKMRLLCTILLSIGICLCINTFFAPIGSYKESEVISSQEIVSYEILGTENYYIESDEFITWFVINEVLSANGKKVETPAITKPKSDVEIIKEKDCKIPRVEEHLIKWESSGWTFAREKNKTVYKIYIPE